MSQLILVLFTALGLGALYFLVASGLSLIFGLMEVLNLAHGALITVGSYSTWWMLQILGDSLGGLGFTFAVCVGVTVGAIVSWVIERFLIRPLYGRHIDQVLVTVGAGLIVVATIAGIFSTTGQRFPVPASLSGTVDILGARVPVNRFLLILVAMAIYVGLQVFLKRTRYGMIIRAGVEDREMVSALGIDVHRAFTFVFVLGGALAALAGSFYGVFAAAITPQAGTSLLIFAFIVVVIGGMGSLRGSAIAALLVAVLQQFINAYGPSGAGEFVVAILLAAALLARRGESNGIGVSL